MMHIVELRFNTTSANYFAPSQAVIVAIICLLGATLFNIGAVSAAGETAALPRVAELVAAESEFAAHSVATDMRQSFIRALGKEGLLLRPSPTPGAAFMAARPAPPIELNWRPSFAFVAASGDVGVTSGPWRITSKINPEAKPSYGHFISLWKRQPDGRWQVAFDTGISHPTASFADAFLVAPSNVPHRTTVARAEATLSRFAALVASGDYSGAVKAYAATDIRVYRDGQPPMNDKAALTALTTEWPQHTLVPLAVPPIAEGMSSSADLIWRLYEVRDSQPKTPASASGVVDANGARLVAHAFTAWRATADGDIELILDAMTKMPTPVSAPVSAAANAQASSPAATSAHNKPALLPPVVAPAR
jgi:hypothetical protein